MASIHQTGPIPEVLCALTTNIMENVIPTLKIKLEDSRIIEIFDLVFKTPYDKSSVLSLESELKLGNIILKKLKLLHKYYNQPNFSGISKITPAELNIFRKMLVEKSEELLYCDGPVQNAATSTPYSESRSQAPSKSEIPATHPNPSKNKSDEPCLDVDISPKHISVRTRGEFNVTRPTIIGYKNSYTLPASALENKEPLMIGAKNKIKVYKE